MRITFTARHYEMDKEMKSLIEKRLQNLKKYFDGLLEANVILAVEKFRNIAEINIQAQRFTLHGKNESEDMRKSIDHVMDKIEGQVKKHKERIRDRREKAKTPKGTEIPAFTDKTWKLDVLSGEDISTSAPEPRIIQTNRYTVKPMSLDEAVLQMDLLDEDVLVFTNDNTNKLSVLYRRKDKNYGLVEPE